MTISDIISIMKIVWKEGFVTLIIIIIILCLITTEEFREKINNHLMNNHPFITALINVVFCGGLILCLIDNMS